jgi:hypothetical protein
MSAGFLISTGLSGVVNSLYQTGIIARKLQETPDFMYQSVTSPPLLRLYYAATVAFLLLDYLVGINLRVAFLEPWPVWRAGYYLFCLGCLGLIIWRPALTLAVSTFESVVTLSALILGMGVRVMGLSMLAPESGGVISVEEIINFIIAGGVAWFGWFRGAEALHKSLRS